MKSPFRFFPLRSLLTLFVISIFLGITGCKSPEPVITEPEATDEEPSAPETEESLPALDEDIEAMLSGMTLEEKIGQLFIVRAPGTFANDQDTEVQRLKRLITDYQVGGLIFFRGDVYGQAVMTNELQKISPVPLWITQDMEFGPAMRVEGTTRFTPSMGIAATGKPENARLKGQITAREAKALGVHQVYAPVLDVNNNPQNPVINVRSYSSDPEVVAEFGLAFIEGIESEGVLATAKHFPGHGDTDTDSHLALPVIRHDYTRIDSLELFPFRKAIDNGLRSVMSAHIAYPNISTSGDKPATLDESILQRILVDSLGFDGLVVTDGLEMQGITDHYSPGEAVVQALLAGADMMLISPDAMTAIHEIKTAVESGLISETRVDRSAGKILQFKKDYGALDWEPIDIETLDKKIDTPEHKVVAERIARESVTVLQNNRNVLPVRDIDYPRVLAIAVSDGHSGTAGSSFASELRNYHANVTFHVLDRRTGEEEKSAILRAADTADLIILGSFIAVRSHHPIQLPEEHIPLLHQLTRRGKPSVLIAFGNPYVVQDLPDTDVHLLAWSSDDQQVAQMVPALFGASTVQGRLPMEIPDMYDFGEGLPLQHSVLRLDRPEASGMNSDSLLIIDTIMQNAIDNSVFPGGIVGVMRKGLLVWHEGYGYHDYTNTRAVEKDDVYDLASLTKVMATTTAMMKLIEQGAVRLDDPVASYIPEFNSGNRRHITIEHLLLHTSGLPAFRNYVDRLRTRDEILQAVRNEPLLSGPDRRYVYSDLGFILLAEVVEQVTGFRIDRYIRDHFFYPMGMHSSHFNPKQVGTWLSRKIPPTEIDHTYRRGTVHGDVHDERAYFMDGIAGHAGLFSSARDIATYTWLLLNGGVYGDRQYLKPETIELFTGTRSSLHNRGYGFNRKNDDASIDPTGTLTGERTYGHTGFTGTCFWVDPDEEIAIILLTNRTWPQRAPARRIQEVRAKIADAVMRSIVD